MISRIRFKREWLLKRVAAAIEAKHDAATRYINHGNFDVYAIAVLELSFWSNILNGTSNYAVYEQENNPRCYVQIPCSVLP